MTADIGELNQLLELIEEHLDLDHCEQVDARYRRVLAGAPTDRPPLVVDAQWDSNWKLPTPWDRFDRYSFRQAFEDTIAMMQNALLDRVVPGLILKDDSPLAIRNNHGTVQIASLLGGNWGMHKNDPPWIKPWDSLDKVHALAESTEPVDLDGGVMGQSIKTLEFYTEQLAKYPKCKQAIQISLPDLQGPFDTAEQLWGSGIYIQ